MGTTQEVKSINEKQDGDSGYVCFYGDKQVGIYAAGLYPAKKAAIEHFKVRKNQEPMISVMLAERSDGSVVSQSTAQFG